jgi:hypothetical protein
MVLAALPDHYYYQVRPCAQVADLLGAPKTDRIYPDCAGWTNGTNLDAVTMVRGFFKPGVSNKAEMGVGLTVGMGAALWFSILLHLVLVEIFVCPLLSLASLMRRNGTN